MSFCHVPRILTINHQSKTGERKREGGKGERMEEEKRIEGEEEREWKRGEGEEEREGTRTERERGERGIGEG